jgi:hypothetical protein
MTLYDYIKKSTDWEITVWDDVYDVEVYFYKPDDYNKLDLWDKAMVELSKLLTISTFNNDGVSVNLSSLIEKHLTILKEKEIFTPISDIDEIMFEINSIISGNVTDKWMWDFVSVLIREETKII